MFSCEELLKKNETKKNERQSDGHNHNQYGERPNNFDVIAKHLKRREKKKKIWAFLKKCSLFLFPFSCLSVVFDAKNGVYALNDFIADLIEIHRNDIAYGIMHDAKV